LNSIEYSLVLSKRKTIAIVVKPDQTVEVRAPRRVLKRDVESFLQLKQAWILARLDEFSQRPEPHQLVYQEGAYHYFLGEPHQIMDASLISANDVNDAVIPLASVNKASADKIQRQLEQWHRKQSMELFTARHDHWREQMSHYDLPESHVGIRKMKRRWGSCTTKGKITFNTMLSKYPLSCVDAVVVHELCHLLEFSHNRRFYQFMGQVYPEWKTCDKLLHNLSLQY